jgi:imidazolonepropionase-like amidohydrolase
MEISKKVYHNFRFFDGASGSLKEGRALFVCGNRIERISEAVTPKDWEDYEPVNLNGLTLLPGLLDLHVHITVPLMTDFRGKEALLSIAKASPP